jgi:small subunit ribosomal protein S15
MALTKEEKKELIQAHSQSTTNTGSTQVQVAMLTKRINDLTEHLKLNKKDFACRRGLMILVGRRRRLLNYFRKTNAPEAYKELITKLGLRK